MVLNIGTLPSQLRTHRWWDPNCQYRASVGSMTLVNNRKHAKTMQAITYRYVF
jgi:hypothetical protein